MTIIIINAGHLSNINMCTKDDYKYRQAPAHRYGNRIYTVVPEIKPSYITVDYILRPMPRPNPDSHVLLLVG